MTSLYGYSTGRGSLKVYDDRRETGFKYAELTMGPLESYSLRTKTEAVFGPHMYV